MTSPANGEIHALSGAYAVDALDEGERAEFERHLAECEACREEVAGLREATALLTEATAVPPPAALRDRVLAEIATVRPLPPQLPPLPAQLPAQESGSESVSGPATVTPLASRRRRLVAGLVAAAAAIAVIGGGAAIWQPWSDDTDATQQVASPMEQVLQAEDAERYTQRFPGGAEATLVRSRSLNRAVLMTEDMPPPPEGKVYEVWLDHEGVGMVPAGLMGEGQDAVVLEGDPATAIGAGITTEPEGGSEEPTGEPVALFPFEDA